MAEFRPMTQARLRKLRKTLGLTQTRFAALLGFDASSVAHWEIGRTQVSAYTQVPFQLLETLLDPGHEHAPRDVHGREAVIGELARASGEPAEVVRILCALMIGKDPRP
jgi:predicted transcriptional regulator